MNGFFLIDKEKGITSFKIVAALRSKLQIKRIGFVGTLDPIASGLMIFAVDEARKLIPYLEKKDKRYSVVMKLGVVSDSYDLDGNLVENYKVEELPEISREVVIDVFEKNLLGEIDQVPPKFSAIWVDGKRAYDLARKGHEVELKSRKALVYDFKLNYVKVPYLSFDVTVSSGTYIRSIVNDLGNLLGFGGVMTDLRRLKVGEFSIDKSVKLEEIEYGNFVNKMLRPEELFQFAKKIDLTQAEYQILARGNFVSNRFGLDFKSYTRNLGPILALMNGVCVGIIEEASVQGEIKFARKFNLN